MSAIIPDPLPFAAAMNAAQASSLTLWLVQIFGEKRQRTDENGTITVARYRGKYYMLDYKPAPEAGRDEQATRNYT